jgi:hypothetical protein
MRLGFERLGERGQGRNQVFRQLLECGEMDCRREDVVRRLAEVDVVVRMHVVAGEGGDDLVRVHVRGRARAGLEDVDRELVVELAGRDPVGGGRDPLRLVAVEEPELAVHARGGGLDPAEPARDGSRDRPAGDREVFDCLAGFHPPELPLLVFRRHHRESIQASHR